MKSMIAALVMVSAGQLAAAQYPAFNVTCKRTSGDSQVQKFTLQVYNENASVGLDLRDELLTYPALFRNTELSQPAHFDGRALSLPTSQTALTTVHSSGA